MTIRTYRMFQHMGVALLLAAASFGVSAQVVQNTTAKPDASTQTDTDLGDASANSTMAELQQLIQTRTLNELRTTYNGNYGASLLFKADDLTYYIAMFQQKNFWRVTKTTSEPQAEQLYKAFVEQTAQLAEVDIRRIKLEAERAVTEKLIDANASRLSALQNDLNMQRQQAQQVAARQEQARQEAAALANDREAANEQLNALQRQIRALEAQQAKFGGVINGDPEPSKKRR